MRYLKRFIKWLMFRPWGTRFGVGSLVHRPWKFFNRNFIQVGKNTYIGPYCIIMPIRKYGPYDYFGQITIGDNVHIGGNTQIHAVSSCTIANNAVISEYVYISDVSHGDLSHVSGPIMAQPLASKGTVEIGEGCFIGFGAAVLPGVRIGKYAVIGARAVVTKSVPDYTMVAGNPARPIKRFDTSESKWVLLE